MGELTNRRMEMTYKLSQSSTSKMAKMTFSANLTGLGKLI